MGIALRPHGRALTGTRSRAPKRQAADRKGEQFSLTVVLFFTLASSAISIYDLVLLFKVIVL